MEQQIVEHIKQSLKTVLAKLAPWQTEEKTTPKRQIHETNIFHTSIIIQSN